METRSFKEVSMKEVKVYSDRTEDDNRRYAYEKAIEAYWKHVDRYHTWMNYYAIFNGALFVGFCTLLTATSKIDLWKQGKDADIMISNDYIYLQLLVCILGIISSFCWLCSLKGHSTWMNNWMRIIEKYEIVNVYNIIIASESEFRLENNSKNRPMLYKEYYKAYSTPNITKVFIRSVISGWILTYVYILVTEFCEKGFSLLNFSIACSLMLIIAFYCFLDYSDHFLDKNIPPIKWMKYLYSNVFGKTIYIRKDKITMIHDEE